MLSAIVLAPTNFYLFGALGKNSHHRVAFNPSVVGGFLVLHQVVQIEPGLDMVVGG
jgi:hypothetical protein